MPSLSDLGRMTEMMTNFYQFVEQEFGGQANFMAVLRRMKAFDDKMQQLGGAECLFKKLDKLKKL